MDMSVGRFWPVRIYPWGKCEALSSIHSDLSALKKLLFEVAYEDLKQDTERRYYAFRERSLFNLDDPNRPVHRSTLAEQLQRTLRMPQRKVGFKGVLGKVLRTALSGVAVYVVVNVLAGAKGQKRLRQDFAVVKEKTGETAAVVADKAQDVGSVVVEKAQEVGTFTAEVAGDVKEAVLNTEEKARRKEEEERAKRGWGPFGLFGKKK
jgi:septin family protein